MLLPSSNRKVPLDFPDYCHEANRRDSRASDKINVPGPFGLNNRIVNKITAEQKEGRRKEDPEIVAFSHISQVKLPYYKRQV